MDLEQLLARAEITDAIMRYCRGIDRGDPELLASAYHEDAQDQHGLFSGTGREFAAVAVARMDGVPLAGQHNVTNILIDFVSSDAADVECYFIALNPNVGATGDPLLNLVGGRYLDRFTLRDGRWAIAQRTVIIDWSREELPGTDWAGVVHPRGGRREADPTWGLLGLGSSR